MLNQQFTLQDIADYLGAELVGDASCIITGINTLQDARVGEISFLANSKYRGYLDQTEASAVIVDKQEAGAVQTNALLVGNAYLGYAKLTALFAEKPLSGSGVANVHGTAVISASATIHTTAIIGPNTTIGDNAVIGKGTYIGAGAVVGERSSIGDNCTIYPNVTLYHGVSVGNDVIIHSGAVLGADGFGFAHDGEGWVKIHQLGGVKIGNNVEIGACTTIDRGALEDTVISDGVILDNQVQIAHNVSIGRNTAMAGQSGIAGSSRVGDNCMLAGKAGVVGHIRVCSGVHVTAGAIITRSITEPGSYSSGTGMAETARWKKNAARFNKFDEIARRLSQLEKRLKKL